MRLFKDSTRLTMTRESQRNCARESGPQTFQHCPSDSPSSNHVFISDTTLLVAVEAKSPKASGYERLTIR
jgi:hypothetical protein